MNLHFNDVSAAIDRYMDILRIDPLHDKASIDLFMIYHGRHEYEKALMTLEQRLELAPNTAVYCNAGICYDLLGDKQKALELYDKGIELNPNEFFILNNRSAIRRVFDDYENGIKDAVRATTANPNFAQIGRAHV